MPDNHDLIEYKEDAQNANGGTELMLRRIYDGTVPRDLLEAVQIHPSSILKQDHDRAQILYLHDLPNQPAYARLNEPWFRDKFDAFVMVSDWQMDRFNMIKSVPYSKSVVMPNGIDPIELTDVDLDNRDQSETINFIYHTTPHRGLQILVPVFIKLAETHPEIHLNVYSSFSVYGWGERDDEFKDLIQQCHDHPQITYHGGVSNDDVRTALKASHIFAYPCIWPETSCLALIEAMSAGLLCIHPNLAALPDTSMKLTSMYQFHEDEQMHANILLRYLEQALEVKEYRRPYLVDTMKALADFKYNWKRIAPRWAQFLHAIATLK